MSMIEDIATLGIRIDMPNGPTANGLLNDLAGNAAKAETATGRLGKEITGTSTALSGMNNVLAVAKPLLAGLGIGVLAKSFLDASSTMEGFQVRLQTLTGSMSEGNRLFEAMTEYAARTPFDFQNVMGAATSLTGVLKGGVDEVKQWMPIIGDLAAASGLSIEETTGQIIRSLSAGAGAADLFRERGINAMLGFKAGVQVSAEETRKTILAAYNDVDSKFRGTTDKLAGTWSGIVSNMGDRWKLFQRDIMDGGPFDALKAEVKTASEAFGEWMETSKKDIAEVSTLTASLVRDIADVTKKVADLSGELGGLFSTTVSGWNELPKWVQELGIVGSVLFGKRGIAAVAGLSWISGEWKKLNDEFLTDSAEITDPGILRMRIRNQKEKLSYQENQIANFTPTLTKDFGVDNLFTDIFAGGFVADIFRNQAAKTRAKLTELEAQLVANPLWRRGEIDISAGSKTGSDIGTDTGTGTDTYKRDALTLTKAQAQAYRSEFKSVYADVAIDEVQAAQDAITEKAKLYRAAGVDEIQLARWVEDQKAGIQDKIRAEEETFKNAQDEANKLRAIKEITTEQQTAIKNLEAARAQAEAAELADARKTMMEDFNNAQETYNFELELLEKRRDRYAHLMKDQAAADAWYAKKKKTLDSELAKSSDSFIAGVRAGYSELEEDLYSWGRAGADVFNTLQSAGKSALSDGLFNYMKGDLDNFGQIWDSFCDSLLRSFTDSVAQMVTQWAIGQAGMAASSASKGIGSLIATLFTSAHGNVFMNGSPVAFATGGLITRPTIFPMATGGLGLAGEAGTEAIMPLKRLGNGNLGVESSGQGVTVNVINNGSQSQASVQQTKTANGGLQLDVLIDDIMSGKVVKGKTHNALVRQQAGYRPNVIRR